MTMDLNELADRVEALAGPDRLIDRDIAIATFQGREDGGCKPRAREVILSHGAQPWNYEVVEISGVSLRSPPAYTGSIDAAMTLVPESRGWSVGQDERGNRAIIGVGGMKTVMAKAANPAIALTAAALRTKALGAVHTLEGGL